MVWITFATDAKVIFLSKENPAGRAVEDLMASFGQLLPDLKSKLSRVMSAQESERHKNQQRPLVLDTKGSVPQIGDVGQALVATTGLVWSSKGNYRSRALQQTQEAEIVVVEEAQQTPDVKTTLSLSHAHPSSLLLLVGDEQQAPGGIEDDHDLKLLRGPLLNVCIGLRALPSEQYRSPHSIPRIIHQLLATLGPLDPAFTFQHLDNVCNPIAPLVIHAARTAPATTGRAASDHAPAAAYLTNLLIDTLPLHLQDTQFSPPTSWVKPMLAYTYTKPPLPWKLQAWQGYTSGALSCPLAPEQLNPFMNPPLPPFTLRCAKCMTASGRLAPHAKPSQQTSLRGRASYDYIQTYLRNAPSP